MENKKIFLYTPFSIHNAYKNAVENVPDGFEFATQEYLNYGGNKGTSERNITKDLLLSVRPRITHAYNRLHILFNSPKCRKFYSTEYDLVHSAQSLLDTNLPYVVDFEHAAVFCGYNQYGLESSGFANALKKHLMNPKLSKLIPWSNASKDSLLNFVKGKDLEEKIEVVYRVITPQKQIQKKKHNGINFLFVGYAFFEKGGIETLLAFDRISEKYDCHLTVVSYVPEEIRAKFAKNQKITILEPQPFEKIVELYHSTDVFVFPTHYDTFGMVIPEAFSYGIPVISTDHFSIPELVDDGKTGILVKSYYSCFRPDRGYAHQTMREHELKRGKDTMSPPESAVSDLSDVMVRLIEDDALRRTLSENAIKETTEGKFSPKVWKEKMGKIYREAVEK